MQNKNRKTVKVGVQETWWSTNIISKDFLLLEKDDLIFFPTKYLLERKEPGLAYSDKKVKYQILKSMNNMPKESGIKGGIKYAVSLDDLKKELSERPHIPNKKESKVIRKAKIKKGK